MKVFVFTGMLFSCQKELYFDQDPEPPVLENHWEFTEEANHFSGPTDSTIYENLWGAESISIYGHSSDNTSKFFLRVSDGGKLKAGTYQNAVLLFSYTIGGITAYQNEPAGVENFSVTINYIDSLSVSGTFEGQTRDASGNAKTISAGKFNARITARRVQSSGVGNGQLVLWSRVGCGQAGTDQIKVSVENKEGNITNFYSIEPDCAATGVASFVLPAGSYDCLVICGTDSVQIVVTVIEGSCTKVEVGFCTVPQTGCRISEDTLFFPPTLTLETKRYTFNAQKQVERMQRINLRNGEILQDLRLSYSGSQIIINQDGMFNVDGCGRIREYVGYDIPGNYQNGKKLFMRFHYDAAGYMEKITTADANSPGMIIEELTLTWTGGNLIKASIRDWTSVANTEYELWYNASVQPKNFICLIPSKPILYLQSALNFGKAPANLVDRVITKATDKLGQFSEDTTYFGAYASDGNNYIKEFNVSGGRSYYYEFGAHFLGYHCY